MQQSIQLEQHIAVHAQRVYEHLSVPDNLAALQPFVRHISPAREDSAPDGTRIQHYETLEHVPLWGILRLPTRVRVEQHLNRPPQQMVNRVFGAFGVVVVFTYDFEAVAGGTRLVETIDARAPALLLHFVLAQARAAQTAVLRNLKQRLEPAL